MLIVVDGVIIPLLIHGKGESPDALAAVDGLVGVGHLTGFDEGNEAVIEHLGVDAEVFEPGVGHGGNTG